MRGGLILAPRTFLPPSGTPLDRTNSLVRGLVSYIPGSAVKGDRGLDLFGVTDGILSGSAIFRQTVNGLAFNTSQAASTWVDWGSLAALRPSSLTWTGTFRIDLLTNAYNVLWSYNAVGDTSYYQLFVKSNGKLAVYFAYEGNTLGASYDGTGALTLEFGKTYRISLVIDSATYTAKAYVNGLLDNTTSAGAGGTAFNTSDGRSVYTGRDLNTAGRQLDAAFNNVSFHNRALSPQEAASFGDLDRGQWQLFIPAAKRIWVPDSVGSGVTGTLAKTNANDTSAASGSPVIVGTLAKTNANDTSAASGTTTVVGTLAKTNANDTSAASGTVGSSGSTGTVAYTNANDTSAASGTTTVTGTLARTNANDSVVASGWAGIISGTLAYTNANDTVVASGSGGTEVASSTPTPAGRPARKRTRNYVVEIDGEDHIVGSVAEARALLDTVQEEAEQVAKVAAERAAKASKKPIRKVLHDARKALQVPQITAPKALAPIAEQALTSVQSLYDSTMRDIEIAALFRRAQAQEDDDEDVLMLMAL